MAIDLDGASTGELVNALSEIAAELASRSAPESATVCMELTESLAAALARGDRIDEHLAAIRSLWHDDKPAFHGRCVDFEDVDADPRPVQRPISVVTGGHSPAALRRAARHADGWYGWMLGRRAAADLLPRLRAAQEEAGAGHAAAHLGEPAQAPGRRIRPEVRRAGCRPASSSSRRWASRWPSWMVRQGARTGRVGGSAGGLRERCAARVRGLTAGGTLLAQSEENAASKAPSGGFMALRARTNSRASGAPWRRSMPASSHSTEMGPS